MTTILISLETLQVRFPTLYFWADTFFKASLVITVAAIFHWLYRRQSASCQGLVWLMALTACLAIPLGKLLVPEVGLEIAVSAAHSGAETLPVTGESPPGAPQTRSAPADWLTLLAVTTGGIYLTGILVMLAGLAASIVSLRYISCAATPATPGKAGDILQALQEIHGTRTRISLFYSNRTQTPFTWGLFRHRIILPETARHWEDSLLRQALAHELGHIQRNDWLFQLLGRLALCLHWPNPLAWFAVRSFKICSEKACDDAVTESSESALAYASNLVNLAASTRSPIFRMPLGVALFCRPSVLTQRIHHLLLTERDRRFLRSDELVTATVFVLILVIPFSALEISARAMEPSPSGWSTIPIRFDIPGTMPDGRPGARTSPPVPADPAVTVPATIIAPDQVPAPWRVATAIRWGFIHRQEESSVIHSDFSVEYLDLFRQWEPAPLRTPLPLYPGHALKNGIEGHVVAEFRINDDGSVYDTRIVESVPAGVFERSVLRAVRQFVYCPEIVDGIGGKNQSVRKRFAFALNDRP